MLHSALSMRRATSIALTVVLFSSFAVAQDQDAPPERDAPNAPGAPSKDAMRMGSPAQAPANTSREATWPAPTADDWKLPCLITWQRNFDDALAVAKATGKPILICVNMDGEIASEHYAGIRYRRADTAKLYEPYVCVIASVYRHTPRDYDEEGQRVLCPRFGTVTCGEHIAIEPLLYDKYFEGSRIAPRHIMLELDQREVYDVYFAWDTQTIFTALAKGIADRPPPPPFIQNDRPMVDRVTSPDVVDRIAIETAYREGTRDVRRALVESALTHRDVDQVDMLRQAIFGFDLELARLARRALAQSDTESAVDLIAEALKVPMDAAEREALIAAAVRLGEKYPRARTLVAVHQGLSKSSQLVDVQSWASAVTKDTDSSAKAAYESASRVEQTAKIAEARPDDGSAQLALAKSFLARANDPETDARFTGVMIEDARKSALEAQRLGAKGWDLHALLAVTAAKLGQRDASLAEAVLAVEGGMPPEASGDGALERETATVFALFAQARQRAIARAYRERAPWPPEWLADIHAAYAILARHPLGTDENAAAHFDFLRWLGAGQRTAEVLQDGLARFPESRILHDRLRSQILWEKGPDALEAAYAAMLAKDDAAPTLEWFAGYASLVAAEHHRRAGDGDKAIAAYERATAHLERYIQKHPDDRDNADHYIALALAGRARIAFERADLERATSEILAAFQKRPDSAASLDGLNISPVDTAKMLRAKLAEANRADLEAALAAGLAALDPKYLELPAYERNLQGRPARQGGGNDRPAPR